MWLPIDLCVSFLTRLIRLFLFFPTGISIVWWRSHLWLCSTVAHIHPCMYSFRWFCHRGHFRRHTDMSQRSPCRMCRGDSLYCDKHNIYGVYQQNCLRLIRLLCTMSIGKTGISVLTQPVNSTQWRINVHQVFGWLWLANCGSLCSASVTNSIMVS